ncbi:TPM domain-containing protein [Niallia sp. Krafla_26]|uniref:TPM domain-containing protein n=1 Tax=Niallia sp. Krafla_26 TaxID=3064703 RepID=UPI003D177D8F
MVMKRFFSLLLIGLSFFLFCSLTFAEDLQIPAPVGDIYVQDFASTLTEAERLELIGIGRSLEDQTSAQVAVLTVETIYDRSIEEFALEAFRQYGIGSAESNNGVLLVFAMNERQVRVEVGYGLEGRLPDGKVGRILDDFAIPYLQNNEANLAIMETYKVLTNEVLAEYGIEEGQQPIQQPIVESTDEGIGIPSWLLLVIVAIVLFLDFKYFGGFLTHILLSIISRGGRGGGNGGPRGGGGGSSGGGGASRGW